MRRYAAIDIMSVMENLADTDREAEFMVQIPETAFISNFTMLINDELFIAEIKGTHSFVLLPPANEVCEGYVFTGVREGVSTTPPGRHTPLGRPPRQTSPQADTPLPGACWDTHLCPVHAGIHTPLPGACWDTVNERGMHPTGMHSCFLL